MLYEKPDELSSEEKEVLLLRALMEAINSMVNRSVFELFHKDPDSSLLFHTHIHQQYFSILLADFLSLETFVPRTSDFLDQLVLICDAPHLCVDANVLKEAVIKLQEWLNKEVEFEHNGETRTLWFPSIDKEIALKITREEFVKICGNISKHNPLGLDRQAKAIKKVFKRNEVEISLTDALLIMDEFYEQFHDDLLNYHASAIVELLNNLRWAVYEYLRPLYSRSKENYWHEGLQLLAYKYIPPSEIKNEYIKTLFWNLMEDVRSEPSIPRFEVTKYLKMRY